jgi:FixJ family two-component response regulator
MTTDNCAFFLDETLSRLNVTSMSRASVEFESEPAEVIKLGGVVHVVDDDASIQKALSRLLRAAGYDVRVYNSSGEFLIRPHEEGDSCLLLDIRMSGPSGLDLQEALRQRGPCIPVIFLSGHGDIETCARAMKNGAVDFLTKPIKRDVLLAAIHTALSRSREERVMRDQHHRFQSRFESLSVREKEVLSGVVAGKLNKEIAAELGTAERTVKAHRSHLMQKMRAHSVAELVHISDILTFPTQRVR